MLFNTILFLACVLSFRKGLQSYFVRPEELPSQIRNLKNFSLACAAVQLGCLFFSDVSVSRQLLADACLVLSLTMFWSPAPADVRSKPIPRNSTSSEFISVPSRFLYLSYVLAWGGALVATSVAPLAAPGILALVAFHLIVLKADTERKKLGSELEPVTEVEAYEIHFLPQTICRFCACREERLTGNGL